MGLVIMELLNYYVSYLLLFNKSSIYPTNKAHKISFPNEKYYFKKNGKAITLRNRKNSICTLKKKSLSHWLKKKISVYHYHNHNHEEVITRD